MSEPSGEAVARVFVAALRERLSESASTIRHCLGQLSDDQVWWRPRESLNSIANLVLHLRGNVEQWIIAGIQRLPDRRNRPAEFAERSNLSRVELERLLDDVVRRADQVLAGLTAAALLEPRRIQGFETTVLEALLSSLPHFQGHTQEIVCLTRLQLGDRYRFRWTPTTREQGAAE